MEQNIGNAWPRYRKLVFWDSLSDKKIHPCEKHFRIYGCKFHMRFTCGTCLWIIKCKWAQCSARVQKVHIKLSGNQWMSICMWLACQGSAFAERNCPEKFWNPKQKWHEEFENWSETSSKIVKACSAVSKCFSGPFAHFSTADVLQVGRFYSPLQICLKLPSGWWLRCYYFLFSGW